MKHYGIDNPEGSDNTEVLIVQTDEYAVDNIYAELVFKETM